MDDVNIFQDAIQVEHFKKEEEQQAQVMGMATDYQTMQETLKASKKGGFFAIFGDSKEFTDVRRSFSEVSKTLVELTKKPENLQEFTAQGQQLDTKLEDAIKACTKYLNKGGGSTKDGAYRKELVRKALLLAMNDRDALQSGMASMTSEGEVDFADFSWGELMRSRTITLEQPLEEQQHVGGAMSDLTVIKRSDDAYGGGFFKKKQEAYVPKGPEECSKVTKEQAKMAFLAEGYHLTAYQKRVIDAANNDGDLPKDDPQIRLFSKYWNSFYNPLKAESDNIKGLRMKTRTVQEKNGNEKQVLDVAARDVGMSKIAALFGLGKLLAHSEQTTVVSNGQKQKGYLMQKAKGEEAYKFTGKLIGEKFRQGIDHPDKDTDSYDKISYKPEEIKEKLTGNFIKDLMNLQILDFICGQKDRHMGNYFISTDEEGKALSVNGIDNNLAFGIYTEEEIKEPMLNVVSSYMCGMFGDNGELLIKHMDMELAGQILAMRPEFISQQLEGLVAPEEATACWERVQMLQAGIQKKLKTKNSGFLLKSDQQWIEHMDDLTHAGEEFYKFTYLGRLINCNSDNGNNTILELKNEAHTELGEKWLQEHKNLSLEDWKKELRTLMGNDFSGFEAARWMSPATVLKKEGLSTLEKTIRKDFMQQLGKEIAQRRFSEAKLQQEAEKNFTGVYLKLQKDEEGTFSKLQQAAERSELAQNEVGPMVVLHKGIMEKFEAVKRSMEMLEKNGGQELVNGQREAFELTEEVRQEARQLCENSSALMCYIALAEVVYENKAASNMAYKAIRLLRLEDIYKASIPMEKEELTLVLQQFEDLKEEDIVSLVSQESYSQYDSQEVVDRYKLLQRGAQAKELLEACRKAKIEVSPQLEAKLFAVGKLCKRFLPKISAAGGNLAVPFEKIKKPVFSKDILELYHEEKDEQQKQIDLARTQPEEKIQQAEQEAHALLDPILDEETVSRQAKVSAAFMKEHIEQFSNNYTESFKDQYRDYIEALKIAGTNPNISNEDVRALPHFMKPVRKDGRGVPMSKKDLDNEAWNEQFIKDYCSLEEEKHNHAVDVFVDTVLEETEKLSEEWLDSEWVFSHPQESVRMIKVLLNMQNIYRLEQGYIQSEKFDKEKAKKIAFIYEKVSGDLSFMLNIYLNQNMNSAVYTQESSIYNPVVIDNSSAQALKKSHENLKDTIKLLLQPGEFCGNLTNNLKDFVKMK